MKYFKLVTFVNFLTFFLLSTQSTVAQSNPGNDAVGSDTGYQFKSALQQQKLTAFDGMADDFYGRAVSISNNRALVGATYQDITVNNVLINDAGAVYYYEFENNQWVFKQKLTASDASLSDEFGNTISLSGDRLMIGSFRNDEAGGDAGAVYVFEYINSTWVETDKLTASDAANGDWFGRIIAINQDTAMISATSNDDLGNSSGKIYVFNHNGTN